MAESMSSETLSTSFEHVSPQVVIPPFWQRLNKFFLFPLQTEPLIYGLVLAACAGGRRGPSEFSTVIKHT